MVKRIDLTAADGTRLDAVVHVPDGTGGAGTVIQVHGITADLDEGGMFVRLADRLAAAGFTVLRFSFRGHGASGGTDLGVTIAGEMLDLDAAVRYAAREHLGPVSVVAASFGAVPVVSSRWLDSWLIGLVLWNPVLDLRRTFLEPELPWGRRNFGPASREALRTEGFLTVDEEFRLGQVLFGEFGRYEPLDDFAEGTSPALLIHGDRDSYVSYDIARKAAMTRPGCEFHTVAGSGHGFDSRDREDEAIKATATWLADRSARS